MPGSPIMLFNLYNCEAGKNLFFFSDDRSNASIKSETA